MEKSSFFNSVNGDRKYKASDFAEFFSSLVTNGVFPNPSTNLQVIANNNMTVTLKLGKAWINGYVYINTDDLILNVNVADGVLNRIDRVILRMDTINREIKASVKKGAFASSPVAPTLQRDADAYELGIADIYVGNGAISITQSNVTDLRLNNSLCGIVGSLIQPDTTAIFNQYLDWFTSKTGQYQSDMSAKEAQFQADFNTWFDTVKNTLGSDIAGNLLNLINDHKNNTNNPHGVTAAQIGAATQIDLNNKVDKVSGKQLSSEDYTTAEKQKLTGLNNYTHPSSHPASMIFMQDGTSVEQKVTSHLADYLKHGVTGTTDATGTSTAYTLTPNPALSAYSKGLAIELFFDKANTGASTINISTLGVKNLKKQDGTSYASGELKINTPYRFVFNGTDFLADSSVGYYGTAGAAQTLSGYTLGTPTGVIAATMPNNGAINVTQTASGQVTTISAGYHNGSGQVTNNITIASLGGKRYATGSGVSSASQVSFVDNTGMSVNYYSFTVSGLSFAPSTILICGNQNSPGKLASAVTKNGGLWPDGYYNCIVSGGSYAVRITGNATITSSGFTLPVPNGASNNFTWYAFE